MTATKTEHINLRLTAKAKRAIERAAKASGKTVTDWMLSICDREIEVTAVNKATIRRLAA